MIKEEDRRGLETLGGEGSVARNLRDGQDQEVGSLSREQGLSGKSLRRARRGGRRGKPTALQTFTGRP